MISRDTKTFDLIISQALDRYAEMDRLTAQATIREEWPEQLAALLTDFICKECCSYCGGPAAFTEITRTDDDTIVIVPICDCAAQVSCE